MQHSLAVRSMLAGAVGLTLSLALPFTAAFAQSTTIDFSNSALDPIPLLDGSAVVIDGNGNVQAQCVLDGTTCQGITGGAGAPTVSLTTASATTIVGSGNISVNWSSTNAPEVCIARATNGYSGWSDVKAATGTQSLAFSTTGSYALTLECYNDNGSGTSQAINVTVEAGQGPVDGCDITSADPLFKPNGFTERRVTWEQAFFGNAHPVIGDGGGLAPVGSFTFANHSSASPGPGMAIAGNYIAIPFVAGNTNRKIEWYGAQANYSRNYKTARPATSTYVTISPCSGDFRGADFSVGGSNPLSSKCRVINQTGAIYYGPSSQCVLTPGETYYVNVLFANPFEGGLTASENTCLNGSAYCDANFNH